MFDAAQNDWRNELYQRQDTLSAAGVYERCTRMLSGLAVYGSKMEYKEPWTVLKDPSWHRGLCSRLYNIRDADEEAVFVFDIEDEDPYNVRGVHLVGTCTHCDGGVALNVPITTRASLWQAKEHGWPTRHRCAKAQPVYLIET